MVGIAKCLIIIVVASFVMIGINLTVEIIFRCIEKGESKRG